MVRWYPGWALAKGRQRPPSAGCTADAFFAASSSRLQLYYGHFHNPALFSLINSTIPCVVMPAVMYGISSSVDFSVL